MIVVNGWARIFVKQTENMTQASNTPATFELSNELVWLKSKATLVKVWEGECNEYEFKGKLPYRMAMAAVLSKFWQKREEGGQGKSSYWWCCAHVEEPKMADYSINFNTYSGIVRFTYMEAI